MDKNLIDLCENTLRQIAADGCYIIVIEELNALTDIKISHELSEIPCGKSVLLKAFSQMYFAGQRSVQTLSAPAHYVEIDKHTKVLKTTIAADKFALDMAPVIKKIRTEGHTTLQSIAVRLTDLGITTANGGLWHAQTVRNIESRAKKLEQLSMD